MKKMPNDTSDSNKKDFGIKNNENKKFSFVKNSGEIDDNSEENGTIYENEEESDEYCDENGEAGEEVEGDEYNDNDLDYANSESNTDPIIFNKIIKSYESHFGFNQHNDKRKRDYDTNTNSSLLPSTSKSQNSEFYSPTKKSKINLEMYEKAESIQINCNGHIGELFKSKFGSGGKGTCIRVIKNTNTKNDEKSLNKIDENWMTPIEFENYCGKGNCRDWKRTLKVGGQNLVTLMNNNILICHAVSCSCAACNKNESLIGPIRPFMRYRRRKKDEILAQNAFKKFLSLKPPTLLQESLQKIQNNNSNNGYMYHNDDEEDEDEDDEIENEKSQNSSINKTSQSLIQNENNEIFETSLDEKSNFMNCLEEFDKAEEKKWAFLEEETNKLFTQAQFLQGLIKQSKQQSKTNRDILIKKFYNYE